MAAPSQTLGSRVLWFAVGGCISVALNAGPFLWLRSHYRLPDHVAYAISLTTVTVIFSLWNYFVNFRTAERWGDCLPKYITAVVFCGVVNYLIAAPSIKQWGDTSEVALLIIGTVQVAVSGLKFLLYHYWVYPRSAVTE